MGNGRKINVVIDYCFSRDQLYQVIDGIWDLDVVIKAVALECQTDTLIRRDRQRTGIARVGEELIGQLAVDFANDHFPRQLILNNDAASLADLADTVIHNSRFDILERPGRESK